MFGIRELFESIDAAVNNEIITPDEAANIYEHVKVKIDQKLAGYHYWIKKGRPEYSIEPLRYQGEQFIDDGWISDACVSEAAIVLDKQTLNSDLGLGLIQTDKPLSDSELAQMTIHSVSTLPCCGALVDSDGSTKQYTGHRYNCPKFHKG